MSEPSLRTPATPATGQIDLSRYLLARVITRAQMGSAILAAFDAAQDDDYGKWAQGQVSTHDARNLPVADAVLTWLAEQRVTVSARDAVRGAVRDV